MSDDVEHLPRSLTTIGESLVIEPLEELHILRWPTDPDDMVLVSCRGALYLVHIRDLERETIRVLRAGRA